MRAEERRRVLLHACFLSTKLFLILQVFGVKPCEMYASMSTSQFVEKFASLLKVESEEHLAKYRVNLAILVSACAEMLNGYVIIVYSVAQVHKVRYPVGFKTASSSGRSVQIGSK